MDREPLAIKGFGRRVRIENAMYQTVSNAEVEELVKAINAAHDADVKEAVEKTRYELREEAIRLTHSRLGIVMAVLQDPGGKQLVSDIKEIVVAMLNAIPVESEAGK